MAVRNTGLGRFGLGRTYGGLIDNTNFAFKTLAAVVVRFTGEYRGALLPRPRRGSCQIWEYILQHHKSFH